MKKSILVVSSDSEWEVSLSDLLNGVDVSVPAADRLDDFLADNTRQLVGALVMGNQNLGKLAQLRRNHPHIRVVFLSQTESVPDSQDPNLLIVPRRNEGDDEVDLGGEIRGFFGLITTPSDDTV